MIFAINVDDWRHCQTGKKPEGKFEYQDPVLFLKVVKSTYHEGERKAQVSAVRISGSKVIPTIRIEILNTPVRASVLPKQFVTENAPEYESFRMLHLNANLSRFVTIDDFTTFTFTATGRYKFNDNISISGALTVNAGMKDIKFVRRDLCFRAGLEWEQYKKVTGTATVSIFGSDTIKLDPKTILESSSRWMLLVIFHLNMVW